MQSSKPGTKNPFTAMILAAFESLPRSMMISLPGHVVSFDAGSQTAQVQCGIQKIANGKGVDITVIEGVPVSFSGSGEWYVFHEVPPGTEGIITFSHRAIDLWVERGGTVKPHDLRMFHTNDAMFSPGIRSKPNAVPNLPESGIGMSNYSGDVRIHLDNSGSSVTGNLDLEGDLEVNGDVEIIGNFSSTGTVTNNSVNIGSTHIHLVAGIPSGPPQ